MNKKKFGGLIIMMLLSIIGIIWVQIIWIRNAINIRNDIFNSSVAIGLSNAANALESSRKMDFFNDYLYNDPLSFTDSSTDITGYLSIGSYSSGADNSFRVRITNQSYSGTADTGILTTVNKSFSFPGDSIVTDSITQVYSQNNQEDRSNLMWNNRNSFFNPVSENIRQEEFINWLKKRSNEFRNMSDQMISEIYRWEKTLELDNKEIDYFIGQSLNFVNIQTPFEFALIKNGEVQEGTYKKSSKNDFLKSNYKIPLFPDNIFRQNVILSVIFPERANYVLGSMAWILGGSLLFSLFILATFALSLFFIIRQKKISEIKSDFINNMTHEFKTPIATISLAADTITNPKIIGNQSSVKHFVSMIKKENSRMNKKVETILQIASLDKKEIEFNFENVSLHNIINHAVDTIEIQLQQRNGTLNLNLKATEDIIYGDIEHLTNLANNLIDNAIKYSPETPVITIETRNNTKGIILAVQDKGVGMTKAVQSKIFERFYRQSSGNVHDVKGFGLGLNYARAIIEAHKGNISVTSEPGKGSRFEIFLPFNWEN